MDVVPRPRPVVACLFFLSYPEAAGEVLVIPGSKKTTGACAIDSRTVTQLVLGNTKQARLELQHQDEVDPSRAAHVLPCNFADADLAPAFGLRTRAGGGRGCFWHRRAWPADGSCQNGSRA